ncbi:MAG: fused MFS/spermidine synthase [Limisphaerales bacterium]
MSQSGSVAVSHKVRLALLLLSFGSGCAALIYEIVWFQLLQLVIGSSAVSLGMLLGVFMGGLCVGSVAFPRFLARGPHPLRVYALLELGIGFLGIGVLFLVPCVAQIYASHGGRGLPGFLFRGLICAACLFPATVLMGATLPALARSVDTSPRGVSWLGLFYGANTLGAVFGCLLAGFYLLRIHDMHTAAYVAAALNGIMAVSAFLLSEPWRMPVDGRARLFLARTGWAWNFRRRAECKSDPASASVPPDRLSGDTVPGCVVPGAGAGLVYFTIALSGLCALGAEVVWTRLLSLMLGPTVYTFSIILAVFLSGLGLGSGVGSFLAQRSLHPGRLLGACQLLLSAGIAWTAFLVTESLPYWPINPFLSRSPWFDFQLDALRCAWAVLPAACLWGASFPLALAAAARSCNDSARLVGRIYAANTAGAVLGALGCSIFLIGWLGTQHVQQILIGLSAVSGLLMFLPRFTSFGGGWLRSASKLSLGRGASLFGGLAVAALLAWTVPAVPWELVAYGRYLPSRTIVGDKLYMGEGINASVAVTELENGVRNFHIAGKLEASTDTWDMRMQRMLGHVPALLHTAPRSVLVVGCGAGVTAGSFVVYPSVKRIVICEIEPLIPRVVAQFFSQENYGVLQDPRTQVIYDDARHYILTTKDTFDIITSDPIHPWVKGAATLYTKEYFELCKRHLNPGGLVTQWVPLYESDHKVVQSELATFFEVFPQGTIWSNDENGAGYDLVLLGRAEAAKIDLDQVQDRLSSPNYARVRQSLQDVGFRSALALLSTYGGQAADLRPWLKHAQINRDRDLRLEYLAGLGLNHNDQAQVYSEMLIYRKFPEALFVGREAQQKALWQLIDRP